jgi:peptide/nickel transport system permease protein
MPPSIRASSIPAEPPAVAVRGRTRRLLDFVRAYPLGAIGAAIMAIFVFAAVFADLITGNSPVSTDASISLLPPGRPHWLGADFMGRDIYSRIVYGAQVSLKVGFLAVIFSIVLATAIGVVSGFFGGVADTIVQRFVDAMIAFPGLVLILLIVAIWGNTLNNVILALAFFGIAGNSRIMRSATLAVRNQTYIEAARAMGASDFRMIVWHVLPNVVATAITLATLGLGAVILTEASLGFLGLGVPPPNPTWGNMLSGQARQFMQQAPWLAIFPGVMLSLAIFGFNMFGDALRDLLDPRMRGSR